MTLHIPLGHSEVLERGYWFKRVIRRPGVADPFNMQVQKAFVEKVTVDFLHVEDSFLIGDARRRSAGFLKQGRASKRVHEKLESSRGQRWQYVIIPTRYRVHRAVLKK